MSTWLRKYNNDCYCYYLFPFLGNYLTIYFLHGLGVCNMGTIIFGEFILLLNMSDFEFYRLLDFNSINIFKEPWCFSNWKFRLWICIKVPCYLNVWSVSITIKLGRISQYSQNSKVIVTDQAILWWLLQLSHPPFVVDSSCLSKKGALSYPVALGCAVSLQFPLGTGHEKNIFLIYEYEYVYEIVCSFDN